MAIFGPKMVQICPRPKNVQKICLPQPPPPSCPPQKSLWDGRESRVNHLVSYARDDSIFSITIKMDDRKEATITVGQEMNSWWR